MINKERIRRFLIPGVIVAVLLGFVGWHFANRQGARAWQEAKAKAEAAGVSLDRADYAGPEIPDEKNLLLHPAFAKELGREDETQFGSWEDRLGDGLGIRQSSLDPGSGETVRYRDWFEEELTEEEAQEKVRKLLEGDEVRVEELSKVVLSYPRRSLMAPGDATDDVTEIGSVATQFAPFRDALAESALMALRSGDGGEALRRIETMDRLREGLEGPSMISLTLSMGFLKEELDLIWEGLRLRSWNQSQLEELSALLEQIDLFTGMASSICFETAFLVENFDRLIAGAVGDAKPSNLSEWILLYGPRGRVERQKALAVEGYLRVLEVIRSGDRRALSRLRESLRDEGLEEGEISTGAILTLVFLAENLVLTEADLLIARANLGVERFFALNGRYPADFSELGGEAVFTSLDYRLGQDDRPRISADVSLGGENPSLHWQFWDEQE